MTDVRAVLSGIARKDITADHNVPLGEIDGWDSLKTVRLVLKIEEVIGRDLTESDIEGLRSVGDVARILAGS